MNLETVKKNIITNNKIYDKRNEYPVDIEFSLPDFCPDIERVLKCSINSKISNLSVLSDTAQIDITSIICVLYVTKDDKLFGYEIPINISKSVNVGMIDFETIKSYNVKTEYVNCRAINSRKVDVHGSISVLLKLIKCEEKNYICDIDDESVVLKKQNEQILQTIGFAQKQINIADDIVLPESKGSISNIIKSDATVVIEECKTIVNKAIVKMTVNYDILYLSSDFRYETIKHSVTASQILDIEGINENSIVKVSNNLCFLNLKAVTDAEGEMRTINTEAKVNIQVVASDLADVCIATDGYCVKYESTLERDIICCEKFITSLNNKFTVSDCINVSAQIGEIIDMRIIPLHYNFKTENGATYICGDVAVCISLEDENGCCKYFEKVVTYQEKLDFDNISESCKFKVDVLPINCHYTITSGNAVEFKCEMNLSGIVVKPFEINAIVAMEILEENKKSFENMPSLVVYYANADESIWDIALKYNTAADKISELNNISTDRLTKDTMLLIPCM